MKWLKCLLALCVLLISQLMAASASYAVSDYDNVTVGGGSFIISYHAQPWTGVACAANTLDLNATWSTLVLNESKWDIGGGGIASSDATSAIGDFRIALERGTGWGVTQVYNTDAGLNSFGSSLMAYGGERDTWLQVWWNDTGTASFADISPFGHTLTANGKVHTAYIYFSGASGHQCEPRVTQYVLSTFAPSTTTAMAIDNSTYAYHWSPVFLNFDITYPQGYEGKIPLSTYAPPAPATTLYNGTVDCTNDSLEYMLITQDGVTNPVPLSNYESIYRAHWSYALTESPYVITVGCGDKVAASFRTDITPMPPTSNDWMCDSTSNPAYCILS